MRELFWSVVALRNLIHRKAIEKKNAVYWKVIEKKNAVYWYLHYNRGLNLFLSVKNNSKIFLLPFLQACNQRLLGKKIITVFFLTPDHWTWMKDVLTGFASSGNFFIQIFHYPPLPSIPSETRNIKCYSMDDIHPTKTGIQLVPALISDLYLTPTSATAENTPLGCPRIVFMHSLVSIYGVYEENSFDGYDYIYCAGRHHVSEFIEYFNKRNLTGKCLIQGGYPRLDDQLKKNEINDGADKSGKPSRTVILAPTLVSPATENASLIPHATELVLSLIESGWHVIFRPHPLNLVYDNAYVTQFNSLIQEFKGNSSFEVDESKDYFETYRRSSVMISDISGTAYTYAFGFEKPVLFIESDASDVVFNQGLLYESRSQIGRTAKTVAEALFYLDDMLSSYTNVKSSIVNLRNSIIFNVGHSANYFVENVDYVLSGKKHPNWIYV